MPLVHIDGCEDLSSVVATAGTVAIVAGRNGNAIQCTGLTGRFDLRLPTPLSDTVTIGMAWKTSAITNVDFSPGPITVSGDIGATPHVAVIRLADGSFQIVRGNSTTPVIGSSAPGLLIANQWYYLELQTKLHDTTGFAILRLNGTEIINVSNVDTKNAGTGTVFDYVKFGIGSNGTSAFDDIYIKAGTGDTFLSDCKVETLYPVADGSSSQWVGSDGDSINNWQLVDEVPPATSDYVQSAVVGNRDLYTMSDLVTTSGNIYGVLHASHAQKADTGLRSMKILSSRTGVTSSPNQTLTTSFQSYHLILPTDPDTGAAWTIANVNALQSGVEVA